MKSAHWLLIVVALAAIAMAYAVHSGRLQLPPQYDPWATLNVSAAPNFLTRYKLARLSHSPTLCHEVLETSGFEYERLTDRETGPQCGFTNAVRIDRTSAQVGEAFSLTCRAAVSLAMWERHVLQPAAQQWFDTHVERLEHYGSYSCRNVYGRANATRSRHATAEAFDVAGFLLADGQRIRVLGDWDEGTRAAAFLRQVRDGACQFFDGVLSPDYNDAHRDHFHLDRGPYRICR